MCVKLVFVLFVCRLFRYCIVRLMRVGMCFKCVVSSDWMVLVILMFMWK